MTRNNIVHEDEYICPKCGAVCSSLTAYHKHYEKEHKKS